MGVIVKLYEYIQDLVAERPEVFLAFALVLCVQLRILGTRTPTYESQSFKNSTLAADIQEAGAAVDDEVADADHSEEPEEHVPYQPIRYTEQEMVERSRAHYTLMNNRRSVRDFSTEDVPREVIDNIIRVGGTGPSGAHTEPWTYVVVRSAEKKREIREIIEAEEKVNYARRMGEKWVDDLSHIGTTWSKPYLEECPYIIIVFKSAHSKNPDGSKKIHYYHEISSSIGVGFLLGAVQNAGLCSVTTTPMNAGPKLRAVCGRPESEKVLVLLPVGYPRSDATVPDLHRKPLNDIMVVV
ncbi:hypothetical protein SARC_07702 [Sphaeroforma arctica JP610]|uniref:Nitroreductase domain-containing protein n=1 Tax=Sphaeroforma arctica JP610 TaxID=667725 RepID=A0A0L0FSY0_9EUKA|nr:hypothetical protein SARC_07702 [Sphaeroforma arctica JP610]KNC79922.1 hypothetical protein SARC_07702 [Sphaeroforma arctica JP610]|eukprot:XP_014153824.1 hypothetical protein SARC_07702 [Sphaeroforma arctica JP610]